MRAVGDHAHSSRSTVLLAVLGLIGCFTEVDHTGWGDSSAGGSAGAIGEAGGVGGAIGGAEAGLVDAPMGSGGSGGSIDGRGSGGVIGTGGGSALGMDGVIASGGTISASGGIGGLVATGGSISAKGGTDGGGISAGGAVAADAPADQKSSGNVGSACTRNNDCDLGNCANGVCCATTCGGCNACAGKMTGKKDGTCAPALAGSDPNEACADETATVPCGNDGTCDGAGNCHYPDNGSDCGTASCNSDTSMLTKSTCNGSHVCMPGTATPCPGSASCANATSCKPTTCTGDSGCAANYFCANGTCTAKYDDGHSCTAGANNQCRNGNCVGTTCCATPCGECHTCANSTGTCNLLGNGTACGTGVCKDGVCSACTAGTDCTVSGDECWLHATSCSTGSSQCVRTTKKANGTECGSGPTCSGNTSYGHWTCQGEGTCTQPAGTPCPSTGCNSGTGLCNSACTSSQTACGTTCCNNSNQYCSGSVCGGKVDNGIACPDGNDQCSSGNCSTFSATGSKICCQSGWSNCSGTCVNLNGDVNNCGSCGNACGSLQCLTSSSPAHCGCGFGAQLSCNSCAGWDFESGGMDNWRVDPGYSGSVSNVSWSGTRAMRIKLDNFGTLLSVPLCSGTYVEMVNRTINIRVALVSDSGYSIPGASGGQPLTMAFTSDAATGCIPGYESWGGAVFTEGDYTTITGTVSTSMCPNTIMSRVQLGFGIPMSTPWYGTVYFDKIWFD
jgi:hypothetical protein